MGWLQRMIGDVVSEVTGQPQGQQDGDSGNTQADNAPAAAATATIPAERVGLNGEFDQSGLAKRVAQAFDATPALADIETVWVAQKGSEVVLKGHVASQELINQLASVARGVSGATGVETDQVTVQ
jgi:hypothetical protein